MSQAATRQPTNLRSRSVVVTGIKEYQSKL